MAISHKALQSAMAKVKELTPRRIHRTLESTLEQVNSWYVGSSSYFGMTYYPSQLRNGKFRERWQGPFERPSTQPERRMIRKGIRKTRTVTRKKTSVNKRTGTRADATKRQATAASKKRAPAKKRTIARRPSAARAASPALELEKLFETTQAKLVLMWGKEANAATKELEGLRKKFDRAAEKRRKLKDRRVVAATHHRQRCSETARRRLEKARLAYTETTAVVSELRSLMEGARARMNTAKLGLARAVSRDKILARFAKDYDKTQEAKPKGTRRKTRKTTRRAAGKTKTEPSVPGPYDSGAGDEGGDAISPAAETASPSEPHAERMPVAPLSSVGG